MMSLKTCHHTSQAVSIMYLQHIHKIKFLYLAALVVSLESQVLSPVWALKSLTHLNLRWLFKLKLLSLSEVFYHDKTLTLPPRINPWDSRAGQLVAHSCTQSAPRSPSMPRHWHPVWCQRCKASPSNLENHSPWTLQHQLSLAFSNAMPCCLWKEKSMAMIQSHHDCLLLLPVQSNIGSNDIFG